MVVVEDVVVGGVQAGLDAVPHHLTGPGWRLELLDLQHRTEASAHTQRVVDRGAMVAAETSYLHSEKGDAGQKVHGGF